MNKECDDGNIENNDGCSDQCLIEQHYVCSDEWMFMSVCKLEAKVEISDVQIEKVSNKNKLNMMIEINPKTNAYKNYKLEEIIQFSNPNLVIQNFTYDDGYFYI